MTFAKFHIENKITSLITLNS